MPRTLNVARDLMRAHARWAERSRALLARHHVAMINLIGAPGSGKTRLLERTVRLLRGTVRWAVLEGDVETTRDADRLARLGCRVNALITEGGCHLEARMVHRALRGLPLERLDLVAVENVGNLVCPAAFDIGEHAKVAVLSIPEGEDKPLKYPALFQEARAVVLTKMDLLPHLDYALDEVRAFLRQVNPDSPVFQVSAATGRGLAAWASWLRDVARSAGAGRVSSVSRSGCRPGTIPGG